MEEWSGLMCLLEVPLSKVTELETDEMLAFDELRGSATDSKGNYYVSDDYQPLHLSHHTHGRCHGVLWHT